MEKIFNNAKMMCVTIYANKYSRIYLPKAVYNLMQDKARDKFDVVDVYADDTQIKVVPNEFGEFLLCRNGSSPNGRVLTLNRQAILKYNITSGHYGCAVGNDGSLTISLERIKKDA